MITPRPPRAVELLLESLGAKAEFRESLLGDLAQEFSERVERDAVRSARWWYYREAVRATPHLLRSWSRGVHARDVTHLFGVAARAWMAVFILGLIIGGMVESSMRALGFSSMGRPIVPGDPRIYAIGLPLSVIVGALGGYAAAWLDRKAPVVAALATGAVWACVNILAAVVAPGQAQPLGYRIAAPIVLVIGAGIGGVLRICTARSSDSDQDSVPVGRPSSS